MAEKPGILGFSHLSNMAVLKSSYLEDPGNRSGEGSPQLEGDTVAGVRYVGVNWEREKQQCHGEEGTFLLRDKGREREGLRKCDIEFTQEETSGPQT